MTRLASRGSALVETSLILVVFLMVLVEVLDIGQLMFFEAMLMDRVRAGTRYAVVSAYNQAAIANMIVYNSPVAPPGTPTGLFGLQTSMVTINRYNVATPSDCIEVIISNFPIAFYGPFLAAKFPSRTFRAVMPSQSLGAIQ